MKRFSLILLVLIILLSFFLRFYKLGDVPIGFHRDEASFGYNAYALLETGREMAGDFMPLHLESLLNSPAGYSYASIPFIYFFGLNEFSVRAPGALFGSLTVLIVFFLVKELFRTIQNKGSTLGEKLGLISALFLALSPWHINLSRVSAENVLVVFFISLGVLLYLQWVRKEKFPLLLLSIVCFAITLTLYQAPRAFLPLFLPLLFLFFHPKPLRKKIIAPVILFLLIIVIPVISILSSHNLTQRIRMLSIFQHPATQLVLDEQIREDQGSGVTVTRFFHNKVTNYSLTFFENYFNHFSYNFLFMDKGYPDRYRVPQMGLLYLFELPLLLFGIWKLFINHKKQAVFLSGWILLAPFGSALTYDDIPNLQRTLIIFPALSIVVAYGFLQVWDLTKKIPLTHLLRIVVILLMTYGFFYYLHQYYVHQINHRPWFRQEGYKQLVTQLAPLQAEYKKVVVTDEESSPATFFLFYEKINPALVQEQIRQRPTELYGLVPFGKYEFVNQQPCPLRLLPQTDTIKESFLSGEKGVLYVNSGKCKVTDERIKTISEIKRSDGTVVFTLQTIK
jgi:4-amino-4-deoxy-L-arabinose transferase-like glycosyltransferase